MLLFDGEGFADNALCKPFEILFLVRLYARAAMNTDLHEFLFFRLS